MWRWHQVRELLSLDAFCSPHLCFLLLLLSLCPVLPPHSQLVLSCTSRKLPRVCSLHGARRGQQVSLCLSQGSHHTTLSIPQQSPGAAGWVPALNPCWDCAGITAGLGMLQGSWGRGWAPCLPSVLHTEHTAHTQGQPSPCSQPGEQGMGMEQGQGIVWAP